MRSNNQAFIICSRIYKAVAFLQTKFVAARNWWPAEKYIVLFKKCTKSQFSNRIFKWRFTKMPQNESKQIRRWPSGPVSVDTRTRNVWCRENLNAVASIGIQCHLKIQLHNSSNRKIIMKTFSPIYFAKSMIYSNASINLYV